MVTEEQVCQYVKGDSVVGLLPPMHSRRGTYVEGLVLDSSLSDAHEIC